MQRRAGVGGEGQVGAVGPEKGERRETAGEGCSPLGVRKCLGESQGGLQEILSSSPVRGQGLIIPL